MLPKLRIIRKRTLKKTRKFGEEQILGLWRAMLTLFLIPGSLATSFPGELHVLVLCCQVTSIDDPLHHAGHSKPPRKGLCRLGCHFGVGSRIGVSCLKSSPPHCFFISLPVKQTESIQDRPSAGVPGSGDKAQTIPFLRLSEACNTSMAVTLLVTEMSRANLCFLPLLFQALECLK